jgi:putative FmdB family regulatory protein
VPTYQYQCTECGDSLEVRQSFTDDALTVCPSCDGALRKVFNAVGVVFKGSGFYRTDSRSSSTSTAAAKSESGTSAGSSAGNSSSSSDSGSSSSSSSSKGGSSSGGSSSSGSGSSKPSAA